MGATGFQCSQRTGIVHDSVMDTATVISIIALGISVLSASGTIATAIVEARRFKREGYSPRWAAEYPNDYTIRLLNRTGEDASGVYVEITGDFRSSNGRVYENLVPADGHIDVPFEIIAEPDGPEAKLSHVVEWRRDGTKDHYRFTPPGPGKRIKAKDRTPVSNHS